MSQAGQFLSQLLSPNANISRYRYLLFAVLLTCTVLSFRRDQAYAIADDPLILGSISGIVKNTAGDAVPDIAVSLYTLRDKYQLLQTTTATDEQGRYRATLLPTGEYQLRFDDPNQVYPSQFYTSFQWLDDAASVLVMGNDVDNIDMSLRGGGYITGLVTLEGEVAPLQANTTIQFYSFHRGSWQKYDEVPLSSALGIYRSAPLLPGEYKVCALGSLPFLYFPLFHCSGGSTLDAAQNITVELATTVSGINIELLGNEVSGMISGTVRNEETVLPNMNVTLYKDYSEGILVPFVRTTTNASGNYLIPGLRSGLYRAQFTDPSGLFATQYYSESVLLERSTPIYLQTGQIISEINVSLVQAGTLDGHVFQPDGSALPDIRVHVWISYTVAESFGHTQDQWTAVANAAVTDGEGYYRIHDLRPGRYRVSFERCTLEENQVTKCVFDYYSTKFKLYGQYPYEALPLASDVLVTAGATTKGIDTVFGWANPIFLPLINR